MENLTPPIFLLTDFGLRDSSAGQVRAVLQDLAPRSPIFDLTHEVDPFDVEHGAWLLETALPALGPHAIVLAVVDPGVGTSRKGIVISTSNRYFVGPDNGLLSAALPPSMRTGLRSPTEARLQGATAYELTNQTFWRHPVASTFHGRDIFAPVAAHLALGTPPDALGPPLDMATALPAWRARTESANLCGKVIHIDRFGNLITTVRRDQLPPRFVVEVGGTLVGATAGTYAAGDGGKPAAVVDSSGFLSIVVAGASAAASLGVGRGAPVVVRQA